MAYADLPERYQPPAVRLRAAGIAAALTNLATADRPRSEKESAIGQFIANQDQGQDGSVNDLMRTVIELGGDEGQVNKARYMIETARRVFQSEIYQLADEIQYAAERQAAIDLGLEYRVF